MKRIDYFLIQINVARSSFPLFFFFHCYSTRVCAPLLTAYKFPPIVPEKLRSLSSFTSADDIYIYIQSPQPVCATVHCKFCFKIPPYSLCRHNFLIKIANRNSFSPILTICFACVCFSDPFFPTKNVIY